MIGQFKTTNPLNIFWLVIITVLLRIAFCYNLTSAPSQPFAQLLQNLLVSHQYYNNLSGLGNVTIAGFLVFVQALLFNFIVNKHNLLGKQTYIPALFYIIFCSVINIFLTLSLPLVCNFFLLYIVNKLIQTYKQPSAITQLFDIGLAISIATIIYYPLACLLLLVWLSLIVLRPFYWQEWLSSLIAFLTILFFLTVYYYYYQSLNIFINMWQPFTTTIYFNTNLNLNQCWVMLPLAIIMLLGLYKISLNFSKSFILVRKALIVLLFLFITVIASFYLNQGFAMAHFILLAIPISLVLAYYFLNAKQKWIYLPLLISILSLTIYYQLGF